MDWGFGFLYVISYVG